MHFPWIALLPLVALLTPNLVEAQPVSLECRYRDGWYLRMNLDFECTHAGCAYELSSSGGSLGKGKVLSREDQRSECGRERITLNLDSDQSLRLERRFGGHYSGILDFHSDLHGIQERIRCKAVH